MKIIGCGLILALVGCTSMTPDRVRVLSEIAGLAAEQGVREWVGNDDARRRSVQAVITALLAMRQNGVTNQDAFVELLSSLPVSTFRSESDELYVSKGLLVWDGELKKAVVVSGDAEQPVMKATLSGLKRALAPLPPKPPGMR